MGAQLQSASHKGSGRRFARRQMSDINVTPFVDVMLVLLIVFMVTAPMLTAGVTVDLPDAAAGPINEKDEKPVEISIDSDGKIFVGKSAVEREKLIALLESTTDKDYERRIFIRADQGLDYGVVMDLIGAVSTSGFKKVALISEPKGK